MLRRFYVPLFVIGIFTLFVMTTMGTTDTMDTVDTVASTFPLAFDRQAPN